MSLATPDRIRTLQRKLYLKAKAEPDYRFYLLYDKVHRTDILRHAYDLVRSNRGAPGVDGVSCAAIEALGLESWLAGIATELRTKTYQPQPVRRVMIPKPGGGERPLGIPTIRDRVVQTAAKLVLEPIFEADLEPTAYGYRPGRGAIDAVKAVHRLLCQGFTADDFVIVSRGHAERALAWTRQVMTRLDLTVNEAKTTVRDARQEHFDFLGYSFGPHRYRKDGHWYLGASPSQKSVQRLKERVGEILISSNNAPWEEVRDRLNHRLRGWAAYFAYGTRTMAYRAADNHVYTKVRGFLTRRHKVPSRGTRQFPDHVVFGKLGVVRLRRLHIGAPSIAAG